MTKRGVKKEIVGMSLLKLEYVVKNTLSEVETEIAIHLGDADLAPHVFESTPYEIVEEFILDPPLEYVSQNPVFVADQLGRLISCLHQQGIVYDNTFLSHALLRQRDNSIRIIDLEGAYWGSDFDIDWNEAMRNLALIFKNRRKRRQAESGSVSKVVGKKSSLS
ncbi:MAG: hypothetical protein U9Q67_03835 [Patescibacteria group bacterium]|nr:hypothetical protein [Patescibacteria group bacterium]